MICHNDVQWGEDNKCKQHRYKGSNHRHDEEGTERSLIRGLIGLLSKME